MSPEPAAIAEPFIGPPAMPEAERTIRRWRVRLQAGLGTAIQQLSAWWQAETDRLILWSPVAVGLGIGLYFAAPEEPALWVGPATLALSLAAALLLWERAALRSIAVAIFLVALGVTAALWRAESRAAPILDGERDYVAVTGRLASIESSESAVRLIIAPESIGGIAPARLPARLRVSTRASTENLWPGDRLRFRARLRPPSPPVVPDGYDFARAAYFDAVGATGFVYGAIERLGPADVADLGTFVSRQIDAVRLWMARRIRAELAGSEGAIAAALITGDRSYIAPEDLEALRGSSLAHLLSISGLHMAMVALGIFAACRMALALLPTVALRWPTKKIAAVLALLGGAAYLALSGAAVPTLRSFIMTALMLTAVLADRPAISLRVVAVSALFILLAMPESLIDPSFQMSFAAVAAIVAAWETRERWRARGGADRAPAGLVGNLAQYVLGAALTSLVAGLATAPFSGFHFARFATYGLAANMAATPVVGLLVMPAGVVAAMALPLGLAEPPLFVMGQGIEAILAIAHWTVAWPGAVTHAPAWPISALLLTVFGGLWLVIWRTPIRLFGLALLLVGLAVAWRHEPPDLLVNADGTNLALRDADGAYALLRRTPGFDAELWLRADGDSRSPAEAVVPAACDATACRFETMRAGRVWRIALIRDGAAIEADARCPDAEIVLAAPVSWSCSTAELVIDRGELAARGATGLWLTQEGIARTDVAAQQGNRPWSAGAR
ncbi:MAG: DUF4131 domain-containing protein [Alphaproteobacteria bacterium]|nr:DUF4131 domain-containing protein [Alphaproteobacteria bacterium]